MLRGHNVSGSYSPVMAKFDRNPTVPRFPQFLREWRKASGETQEGLAEKIGCSHSAISQLERDEVDYTRDMLESFAFFLRCRPSDLLRPRASVPASSGTAELEELLSEALSTLDHDSTPRHEWPGILADVARDYARRDQSAETRPDDAPPKARAGRPAAPPPPAASAKRSSPQPRTPPRRAGSRSGT